MVFGIDPIVLIASLMAASTPILLAAIGELVVEKTGVLNLGVEGMMITGAVCGFIVTMQTGSPGAGFGEGPPIRFAWNSWGESTQEPSVRKQPPPQRTTLGAVGHRAGKRVPTAAAVAGRQVP